MNQNLLTEIRKGCETAFIDGSINSSLAYRPQFVTNDYRNGVKVLSHIENVSAR